MNLIFEKEFVCKDCGFEFDIPENGDLCPDCFSPNVDHTRSSRIVPLKHIEFFPNKTRSKTYARRLTQEVPDALYYILVSRYGYVDGKQYVPDLQQATLYTTRIAAKKKIENSPLRGLSIREVEVRNNIVKLK